MTTQPVEMADFKEAGNNKTIDITNDVKQSTNSNIEPLTIYKFSSIIKNKFLLIGLSICFLFSALAWGLLIQTAEQLVLTNSMNCDNFKVLNTQKYLTPSVGSHKTNYTLFNPKVKINFIKKDIINILSTMRIVPEFISSGCYMRFNLSLIIHVICAENDALQYCKIYKYKNTNNCFNKTYNDVYFYDDLTSFTWGGIQLNYIKEYYSDVIILNDGIKVSFTDDYMIINNFVNDLFEDAFCIKRISVPQFFSDNSLRQIIVGFGLASSIGSILISLIQLLSKYTSKECWRSMFYKRSVIFKNTNEDLSLKHIIVDESGLSRQIIDPHTFVLSPKTINNAT
jgi:hypothetical protein